MKVVILDVLVNGYTIRETAERIIREADRTNEPTVVILKYVGDVTHKRFSRSVATHGDVDTAREYFETVVANFDRTYDYSDDHRVWKRGFETSKLIVELRKELEARGIDVSDIAARYSL